MGEIKKEIAEWDKILEQLEQDNIKSNEIIERLKKKIIKEQEILVDLIIQRDKTKSDTLFKLLNEEITAYIELTSIFGEYMVFQVNEFKKASESCTEHDHNFNNYANNVLETLHDPKVNELNKQLSSAFLYKIINPYYFNRISYLQLINYIKFNININSDLYIEAISRDFKDWTVFIKTITGKITDSITESVPVVSELKSLYDFVKEIADLVNEYEKNGTDYSNEDDKMHQIEVHIQVMTIAIIYFSQILENLKSSQNNLSPEETTNLDES